jgi:hypothetical protein
VAAASRRTELGHHAPPTVILTKEGSVRAWLMPHDDLRDSATLLTQPRRVIVRATDRRPNPALVTPRPSGASWHPQRPRADAPSVRPEALEGPNGATDATSHPHTPKRIRAIIA